LKEENETGVYFTYSVWDSQEHLDAYRFTPLFKMVWPKVKEWFADKPEAWSTTVILESV
jgi:quinol monooxygenase YgiN